MSTNQYTTGKLGLIEPGSGNYVDVWDTPLYANWQTLDASVSGTTTITLTNLNVYLVVPTFPTYPNPPSTSLSAQNLRLLLNGTLSANVSIYIPSGVGGFWIIDNQTTGSYTVTILTTATGSTGVAPLQSFASLVYSDGANVKFGDLGGALYAIENFVPQFPAGAIVQFGMITSPAGWLVCDGTAYSRSTYSNLFTAIGTSWGQGNGSTTFNVPNFQGTFLRGWNPNTTGYDPNRAFASYQADAVGPLTVTDPGHSHVYQRTPDNAAQAAGGPSPNRGYNYPDNTTTSATGISVRGTSTASETIVKNYAVQYCIKT